MGNLKEIIERIKTGRITVKYNSWSFAGGRDYGDWDIYRLYKSDKEYGSLSVGFDRYEVEIMIAGKTDFLDLSEEEYSDLFCTLIAALKRDDQEFVKMITFDNEFSLEFCLPRDYGDISREDIMTGRWKRE